MTTNYDAAVTGIAPDLQYRAEFVPQSKSRNAENKDPSLNWRVTFSRGGRELTTDYMQGIGHLPGYQQRGFNAKSIAGDANVRKACEEGRSLGADPWGPLGKKLDAPGVADVLHCLLMDAEVIDAGSFEEWASNYGYDTDSRKAESIYRACLDTALKLRAMLGDDLIGQLREALQDM